MVSEGSEWNSNDDLFNWELSARDHLHTTFMKEVGDLGEYRNIYSQEV